MNGNRNSRPLDARLAAWLIRPLLGSRITPNHLTTVRLLVGLGGCIALALGGPLWSNAGALLFALSNFLDHTDGELARAAGSHSRFGHLYDLASDALINALVFLCIGIGLRHGELGDLAPLLGLIAGVAVSLIFHLRYLIEESHGKEATRQPRLGAFEAEDVLYLLPLVSLAGALEGFLIAAAIGAPAALLIVAAQYRRVCGKGAVQ
ncbi:MAG: CDP-alcohol phosphatidyltransferase family protein [Gammaproteobacteria bacterium]|nr:MAG: CDP-alcohol phosphatidyltransferase family protein [Gammaproteobacteria bacterium]